MQRDPTTVFFVMPAADCAIPFGFLPFSILPFSRSHSMHLRRKIFTWIMTSFTVTTWTTQTTFSCRFQYSVLSFLTHRTTFVLLAMVTRSTLPGPTPQCDRIAQRVSNVASTLRLAASSLDEIHDILRGQPPPAPTMDYPPVLQTLGLPPRPPTLNHPNPHPPAPHHLRGNLRPIAAPSQLGASTSDDEPSFPDPSHVPRIPSSLDDSDCSSAPALPPPTKRPRAPRPAKAKTKSRPSTPPSASTRRRSQLCQELQENWDSWEPWQEEQLVDMKTNSWTFIAKKLQCTPAQCKARWSEILSLSRHHECRPH